MVRIVNSFKIRRGNKILDYRSGEDLDLSKVKEFLQQNYQIKKLWKGPRHILGILVKGKKTYFLKLATSEGISVVTKNELNWNSYYNSNAFNNDYLVPKNIASGIYNKRYFYLITEYFAGKLLHELRIPSHNSNLLNKYIPQIIKFSEVIQNLPKAKFAVSYYQKENYQKRFIHKTNTWFTDIPVEVCKKYEIETLLKVVEDRTGDLSSKPRHGDFAPWHMIKLANQKLGLIDGEHALPDGVENYDLCYFIQRVFSVLENPGTAKRIYLKLIEKGHKANKLKTVLVARAVGGFLDESLMDKPNYEFAESFKKWVIDI